MDRFLGKIAVFALRKDKGWHVNFSEVEKQSFCQFVYNKVLLLLQVLSRREVPKSHHLRLLRGSLREKQAISIENQAKNVVKICPSVVGNRTRFVSLLSSVPFHRHQWPSVTVIGLVGCHQRKAAETEQALVSVIDSATTTTVIIVIGGG